MDNGSADPAAALRRVGLGVTASLLAVHTALAASASHSSDDGVVSAARKRLRDGSAKTVYNVLRTFTSVGLIRRIEPAGQARTNCVSATSTTTLSAFAATPSPMSTVRLTTPRASRPPPTRATRSTKPRPSTGADAASVSR